LTHYACANCGRAYPDEFEYKCSVCGGTFDIRGGIEFRFQDIDQSEIGIWEYRSTFGLEKNTAPVCLGEGATPLVRLPHDQREIWVKNEAANPTGSFKDRLTTVEISFLKQRGIQFAVEDSSGNAGASFAAYAAAAGIQGRVYIPSYASGPKRKQIEAYGQEVVVVPGPRSAAAEAVAKAIMDEGAAYASHAYLPHGLTGLATIAYELYDAFGRMPGTIVAPVGHGSLLYGIILGFLAIATAENISDMPDFIGVQAAVCAPLWAFSQMGPPGLAWATEGETLAEGIRVKSPIRGEALINLMKTVNLKFHATEEENIMHSRDQLAKFGFYVEPTSAVVWDAAEHRKESLREPVVLILTGSGLKYG
jgi:threonine synthase